MTTIQTKRLTWIFVALVIPSTAVELVLHTASLSQPPTILDLLQIVSFAILTPLVFVVLGKMILNQQPENKVGWLMILVGLTATTPYSTYLETLSSPPTIITPGLFLLLWVQNWSWIPTILAIFLILLYFPTGRLPSPGWKWVPRFSIFLCFYLAFAIAFNTEIGPLEGSWSPLSNPIGFIPSGALDGPILMLFGVGLMTVIGSSLVALIIRFRKASRDERLQIKWLLYAGALFAISYGLTFFLTDPDTNEGWTSVWFVLSVLTIPVAIAIAILRYRLYEIDVIIRKTMIYAILTAILGSVYFGMVVMLQTAVGRATEEQSPLIIVFSTLLIAALFSPLRRRIQDFIDRRFYRRKYDAAQLLSQFATAARDEVDMDKLSTALMGIVTESMQSETVSLWLKSEPVTTKGRKR